MEGDRAVLDDQTVVAAAYRDAIDEYLVRRGGGKGGDEHDAFLLSKPPHANGHVVQENGTKADAQDNPVAGAGAGHIEVQGLKARDSSSNRTADAYARIGRHNHIQVTEDNHSARSRVQAYDGPA